ncbi:MAG TPA: MFS transporter [Sporichthya sp.]|nr:MFS transporter [Sporichthya sp.]
MAVAGNLVVLIVYCLPLSILPAISEGVGAGPDTQTWLLASVSLGMATTLLPAGALGDDYGRRRVFVAGAVLLALASLVCAVAHSPGLFLAGALAQGVGSAAVMACSLGLIVHAYPEGPARSGATGIWGASLASGIGIGPWMAAGLEPVAGWEASFFLAAAFAAVLAGVAQRLLVESRAPDHKPVDPIGMVLLGSAVGALIGGMVRGRSGWSDPPTVALLCAAGVLTVLFALFEARHKAPMLPLSLFRSRRFLAATLASSAMGLGMITVLSYVSTAVQRGLGADALAGAGLVTCWSVASVSTSLGVSRFLRGQDGRHQLAFGQLVIGIGLLSMWGLDTGSPAWTLTAGFVLSGIGAGIANAAIGGEAVAAVPAGRGSLASGANITARYIGSSIGVAIFATIVAGHGTGPGGVTAGWNLAILVTAGFSLLGALAVLACRPTPI